VVFTEEVGDYREFGNISSWDERHIFVKYGGNQTANATRPEDLSWSITGVNHGQ
jgi:hypothetical protein